MPKLTRKIAGTCDNGPCPAVIETDDPALLAVQGARLPSGDLNGFTVPEHETIVLVPRDLLEGLSRGH